MAAFILESLVLRSCSNDAVQLDAVLVAAGELRLGTTSVEADPCTPPPGVPDTSLCHPPITVAVKKSTTGGYPADMYDPNAASGGNNNPAGTASGCSVQPGAGRSRSFPRRRFAFPTITTARRGWWQRRNDERGGPIQAASTKRRHPQALVTPRMSAIFVAMSADENASMRRFETFAEKPSEQEKKQQLPGALLLATMGQGKRLEGGC